MERDASIYVAGAATVAGAALLRRLDDHGYTNVIPPQQTPDPANAVRIEEFFAAARPQYVLVAGGLAGGIQANLDRPAELMLDNLLLAANILPAAWRNDCRKLLYLGSSCSYPRNCPQPMKPHSLWTGLLEPSNEAYAAAKLTGLTLCRAMRVQRGADFICAIPADAFGPGDDFSLENSHVVPAVLRKLVEARASGAPAVELWGTGNPVRDFIFSDDLADACIFLMQHYSDSAPINIGSGSGTSIRALAELARSVVGYEGELRFDPTRPDGTPIKLLDSTPLYAMGWQPRTPLPQALARTLAWYLEERNPS